MNSSLLQIIPHTDLAWSAGIIDGEGCIHIRRDKCSSKTRHASDSYALLLKVTMTDRKTVEKLREIFGIGSVTTYQPKAKNHKRSYSWTCMSWDAFQVLQFTYLWLVTKRFQARLAFKFMDLGTARRGRQRVPAALLQKRKQLYWTMREAK